MNLPCFPTIDYLFKFGFLYAKMSSCCWQAYVIRIWLIRIWLIIVRIFMWGKLYLFLEVMDKLYDELICPCYCCRNHMRPSNIKRASKQLMPFWKNFLTMEVCKFWHFLFMHCFLYFCIIDTLNKRFSRFWSFVWGTIKRILCFVFSY